MSTNIKVEPFDEDLIEKKAELSEEKQKLYHDIGYQLIRSGKVAVVVLAGGQGSRLGFEHPKGMYSPPGLPLEKSIFQLLVERFYKVQLNALDLKLENDKIPHQHFKCKMLIMTSQENHNETVQFFEQNGYFGGNETLFEFFP